MKSKLAGSIPNRVKSDTPTNQRKSNQNNSLSSNWESSNSDFVQMVNKSKQALQLKTMGELFNSKPAIQLISLDDEELLQGKFETIQKQGMDEEELLQGKFETVQLVNIEDEEILQGKFETAQKQGMDEELLQGKFETIQKKENNTGLPDNLKSGIENLSGYAMDDVKVHYNSPKPANLQAHAYAQGTDIHIASGQEKYLPHEAWHVVQQKQGRVKPTLQMKQGVNVNDDAGLEKEADVMGGRATQNKIDSKQPVKQFFKTKYINSLVQRQPMVTGEFIDPTPTEGEILKATGNPLRSPMFKPTARFDLIKGNDESKYSFGEYRQYVKGAFRSGGEAGRHVLKSGLMSEDQWLEDQIKAHRYGYRFRSQGTFTNDLGEIDRANGRNYQSSDQPSANMDDDEIDLHFKGKLIDTRDNNREITVRNWSVYGSKKDN